VGLDWMVMYSCVYTETVIDKRREFKKDTHIILTDHVKAFNKVN
jgi:hypothetical protein